MPEPMTLYFSVRRRKPRIIGIMVACWVLVIFIGPWRIAIGPHINNEEATDDRA